MEKLPRILVVDDKRTIRLLLARYLSQGGYSDIIQAASGEEALEIVDSQKPDLLLLDIMMPGIDGFEVCRRLKENENTRMIPIIIVSALEDRESRLQCYQAGADEFLNKPVDSTEMLARINSLLRIKNYFEQLQESNAKLLQNLQTAQRIQKALLPRSFPRVKELGFDAYYQPAEYLGGDYYNVFPLDGETFCFYIADVTGHYLDAAMLTVYLKEAIAGYSRQMRQRGELFSPRECLAELDRLFKKEDFPEDLFITLFLAVFDPSTRSITYSAAGFAEFPYLYGNGDLLELSCPGSLIMPLGPAGSFAEKSCTLHENQGIFLYTDGLIEQPGESRQDFFGRERVQEILLQMQGQQMKSTIPTMLDQLQHFAGSTFDDDIALLNIFPAEGK